MILLALAGDGTKDLPFPFCLPHLNFYLRCREVVPRLQRWMPLPRSQVERRVIKQLFTVITSLEKNEHFARVAPLLEKRWEAFCELRDILRLTDAELPRGDRRELIDRGLPAFEAERLHAIEEKTIAYHKEIRQRVACAQAESQKTTEKSAEAIILKYLDRYSSHLFGHPLLIEDGNILAVVKRTNNVAEHFFGADKQKLRRRLGRANFGRDLEDQPAQAVLVSNLNHPDYVKITCGSLENLPISFAQLGRGKVKNESTLQRSNKDTELMKYICAMITDEKSLHHTDCN